MIWDGNLLCIGRAEAFDVLIREERCESGGGYSGGDFRLRANRYEEGRDSEGGGP